MNLGLKIKNLREERGLTQLELANLSGISRASIQLYEADKVEIPVKKLSSISRVLDVDADFFIKDKSSLVVRKSFVSNKNSVVSPANLKKSQKEQIAEDQIFIRKLSSAVGAGESVDIEGVEVYDTDVLVPFSRMLFNLPVNEHNIRCLKVVGYSMIPMLYPDSWVIARMGPSFDGDGLYIIDFGGNFMVKLLQKHPNGTLFVNSVNQEYHSYEIGPNDEIRVQIVGKVLRCVI